MYRVLKRTALKELHIVRYAENFKLLTTSYKQAIKIYHAVRGYVKIRLKLNISADKSKITNLRRIYSELLGFELKVEKQKNNEHATISKVSKKSKQKIKREVRQKIKNISKNPAIRNISHYNLYIRGILNYYQIATRVNNNFGDLYFSCLPTLYNRLRKVARYEKPRNQSITFKNYYSPGQRTFKIKGIYLFPVQDVRWKRPEYHKP